MEKFLRKKIEERKVKEDVVVEEDMDMDVAKENEGDEEETINPLEVMEKEKVEGIFLEQMKGIMINLILNVIIVISMIIFLGSVEPMLKKGSILLVIKKVKENVPFGISSKVKIQGKSTILMSLKDGSHKFIKDVYYVPKIRNNILSLGQLVEKGYEILIEDSLWLKDQNSNLVAKVFMSRNRMFTLSIKTNEEKFLKANIKR
ncbi:hypothetical protein CR513_34655, partial [Mucuna pruriens]